MGSPVVAVEIGLQKWLHPQMEPISPEMAPPQIAASKNGYFHKYFICDHIPPDNHGNVIAKNHSILFMVDVDQSKSLNNVTFGGLGKHV